MDITERALSSLEKTGISVSLILLVAAIIFAYYMVQQIKLTNLQISVAQKQLGIDDYTNTQLVKNIFGINPN